jgi:hypothetical protein
MNRDNDWCILRTSGRHTMSLAQSLEEDGYDVWTPIETKTVRVPRANAKRKVRLPIMPSYVFAKVVHLVDLLQLAAMPVKPRRGARCMDPAHPSFTVLHAFGGIPTIKDAHLDELRKLEAKRTPIKRAAYSFPADASARVKGGVFGGMVGVVVRSSPTETILRFDRGFPVGIPTSILELDGVSELDSAALIAA